VKDEEPGQFSQQCRVKPGMDQSGYFDLLGWKMSSKMRNSTWRF